MLCTLPCRHELHKDCVEELRRQGVQQACPLCRTPLSPGPEQLFEDATCIYVRVAMRHRAVGESWKPTKASEETDMAQLVNMWTNAANQGHVRAQSQLGFSYQSGSGVAQDYIKAVQWLRKATDQGLAKAQFKLGYLFSSGNGVTQDYNEAL